MKKLPDNCTALTACGKKVFEALKEMNQKREAAVDDVWDSRVFVRLLAVFEIFAGLSLIALIGSFVSSAHDGRYWSSACTWSAVAFALSILAAIVSWRSDRTASMCEAKRSELVKAQKTDQRYLAADLITDAIVYYDRLLGQYVEAFETVGEKTANEDGPTLDEFWKLLVETRVTIVRSIDFFNLNDSFFLQGSQTNPPADQQWLTQRERLASFLAMRSGPDFRRGLLTAVDHAPLPVDATT